MLGTTQHTTGNLLRAVTFKRHGRPTLQVLLAFVTMNSGKRTREDASLTDLDSRVQKQLNLDINAIYGRTPFVERTVDLESDKTLAMLMNSGARDCDDTSVTDPLDPLSTFEVGLLLLFVKVYLKRFND